MGIRGGEAEAEEEESTKASFLPPDLLQSVVQNCAFAGSFGNSRGPQIPHIFGLWR
jgi:hypothetical protein